MNSALELITKFLDNHKETEQAVTLLETFASHAWQFEEYNDIAQCFFKIKVYKQALEYGELALTTAYTNERMYVARANLINIANHYNYPEKALELIKIQESVFDGDQQTRLEKAFAYFLMNDRDSAEAILLKELERDDLTEETETKIKFNLGTYKLWRDEFQEGLKGFLLEGEKLDYWRKSKLPFRFWDGGVMPGRNIILYAEAGIGDEIINIRFMKHLKDVGMNPIWFSDRKDLVEIFNANGFNATSDKSKIMQLDNPVWTYPMSVPIYLGLEYKDLWDGPYINSLPEYDDKWAWMKESTKLKVGLRWEGNPDYDQDLHRSVPLEQIMYEIGDCGAEFYSLQRDTGVEQLEFFSEITDLSDQLETFKDTLSVIQNLDIVITSCTSIAHAAAAMGKRVIIFVPISAYYTWSHSTEQSPWYGENVTLLRQKSPRTWDEPLKELGVWV
jgi:tetratricopeptide (TPR) repeat protein